MQDVRDRVEVPPESREPLRRGGGMQQASATALICLPLAAVVYAVVRFWGHGIGWFDLSLAIALYLITGHGLAVGFHRMLTHGSFRATRSLKMALAIAGSMGVEGSVYTWVAQHRRHHAYADREGDPHSPWLYGTGVGAQVRGLWHAHMGWFFSANPSEPERWIPDLLDDKDLDFVSRTAWLLVAGVTPASLPTRTGNYPKCRGGPPRLPVGGPGPDGRTPSRHLGGELVRPHVREPAVPDTRPEHQRGGYGPAQLRGLVAQRPSRLPVAGPPRSGPLAG